MNTNLHLSYFGGSGGFFALWHLLVGTDYNCVFENTDQWYNNIKGKDWPALSDLPATIFDLPDAIQEELNNNQGWKLIAEQAIENRLFSIANSSPKSVDSIIYKQHWNISKDRTKWKSTEIWPDNYLTQLSDHKHKLFYTCNPEKEDIIIGYDKKILLYTDYKTQDMLAKNKNAWRWFRGQRPTVDEKTTEFAGDTVYYKVAKMAEYTDYQIKLQDIIKTNGQALLDILNIPINEDNIYHNNMWLNLHTNEERKQLLNESQNT
tara:strand:- start:410 stop:1198 length:789 start_codon:yes stop_codon:yes gene_type:complete